MLSYQTILFWHLGQCDLPETIPFSFGKRKIHTFAKLPQSAPRIITKAKSTDIIVYILKFDVTWISPSINNWTINTASWRCMYKFGVLIIISIV